MEKRCIRIVVLAIFVLSVAACSQYGGLNHHLDFILGMTKREAFDVACRYEQQGTIDETVALRVGEDWLNNYGESICDQYEIAMAASQWDFIESPEWHLRDRYVFLEFENDALTEIRLAPRGWDP